MQPLVLVGLKHSLTLPRRQRQRRSYIIRARVVLRVTEAHVPLGTTGEEALHVRHVLTLIREERWEGEPSSTGECSAQEASQEVI